MRLQNKVIVIIGLTLSAIILASLITPANHSLITFSTIVLFVGIAAFSIFDQLIIKRIVQIRNRIRNNEDKKLNADDEISEIAIDVETMIQRIANKESENVNNLTKLSEIEELNELLQREVQRQQFIAKNLTASTQTTQSDGVALPSRLLFIEMLNKAISYAKRHTKILSVLLIDIGDFNAVKARIGDENSAIILNELSRNFMQVLRSEDVLAKLDGDHFVVLLSDIGKAKFASAVAEKILHSCSAPFVINNENISINCNIGVSIYPDDGATIEDLLQNADEGLFQAKKLGSGHYQFHNKLIDTEAHEYIELGNSLRKAIHNRELTLYFQPKLNVKQGVITGVETLIRWEHPTLGLISPNQFIPVAEETGLIMHIGEWVLRESCKINKYWQDEGYEHKTISVNLSPKQFHHPKIIKMIESALTESKLNPNYLEIEITEKVAMDDTEKTLAILSNLKALGVHISIDHFGTGYTSISHLKQFPLNEIKIDQNFIKGIPNNPNDMAITGAIIALAHNLGIEIVAEGVETAEQVQFLAGQNCDMIQGYYLSHPLPASAIITQFKKIRDSVLI